MPDPRDELAYADMANEPGFVPPREPLRIRVSPYDTPPPSDTGWGGFGAGGRPTGRLFEPDLEPAPPPEPKPQFQPGLLSLGNVVRGIGSLVQGAGDGASAPAQPTAPPAARDPTAGPRQMFQQGYPSAPYKSMFEGPATTALEASGIPEFIESGKGYFAPESTPGERQQRAQQQVQTGANVTANLAGLGMTGASIRGGSTLGSVGGKLPEFKTVRGAEASESGYVYHATSKENVQSIAESGKLNTHKAHEFTDQRTWPDGATEKRNYFTPTAENTWQFAPEEGSPVLLRMRQDAHPIKRERTGDLYSTKSVPAEQLEYLGSDNKWYPVKPKVDPGSGFELGAFGGSFPTLRGKAADEAWRGIEREPKLRTSVHPYSNVGGTPIREMESPIIRGAPKGVPPTVNIEKDLSNAEFIFTSGDANAAGGKLYGSKNLPFEDPVGRHGGPGYGQIMQGQKVEGASGVSPVWASMKGPMGEVLNIAKDVERRGKEPWQVYMTGGKQYLDSSMQMVDTAVQAAKSKGVSTTANEHIVNVMRSDWNTAADPKRLFPETGLHDEKALREWINASPQPQRAKLVKAMDTKQARELGFPNVGELRVWNTDARMLTAPPGSAGLTMARINPSAGTIASHHPAYDTAIAGTDVKTLGMQVPHQIIAPTMHESRMATLNKPQYYQAAPHLYFPGGGSKATKTEPVTNKLKDILQRWMLDNPGGLAVAGTAGGIGSVVDPSRYQPGGT